MIKPFAKLFTFEDIGQVLAVIDDSDDGPSVKFSFTPHENLGVCSVNSSFPDNDEGWASAEKLFAVLDADAARRVVTPVIKEMTERFGGRLGGEA
ncbi:hypothetical protein phiK7B1_048 [Pseudomonas phage phiK7B1]|nr:hypothetical protein phiK7B1_048 [Pseudomonas phage phiK7B1]